MSVAKDGNGNFTSTDGPGLDSGANNGIVRTHSTVQYKVDVNVKGGTAKNETFTLDAPAGTEWRQLPTICTGPGSKIDGKQLICNLGDLTNASRSVPVLLHVTGEAKNGDTLPLSATVSSDNAPGKTVHAKPVTVSAAPKFDLSKQGGSLTRNQAEGPNGEPGMVYQFPILVETKSQADPAHSPKLGSEALSSPVSFTDDISQILDGKASAGARLYDWGPMAACGPFPASRPGSQPAGRDGGAAGVTESGTFACTQPAPGQNIGVTITGADTTADHVPTRATNGRALRANSSYVISGYIRIWIPQDEINAAAEGKPGGVVDIKNTYSGFDPRSVSGLSNYGSGTEPTGNNSAVTNVVINGRLLLNKQYEDMEGGPGGTATDYKTGDGFVTPDETFRSRIRITNSGVTPYDPVMACDTFDNEVQTLSPDANGVYAFSRNTGNPVKIEYAAADWGSPRDIQQADCNDADGPWFDDPTKVPGGIAAVGKVRFTGTLPGSRQGYYYTNLKVADGVEDGARLRNFGEAKARQLWVHDTGDPDEALGRAADRLTVTSVLTRVKKRVVEPGQTAETAVDRPSFLITAGRTATYALYPSLTSKANGTGTHDVTVVDTLPKHIQYAGDASVEPQSVRPNPDGTTTVTWVLKDRKVNEPIDPITFTVRASSTAPETTAVNEVVTSTPADKSPEEQRKSTSALRIAHGAALAVEKEAPVPVEKVGDDLHYNLTIANHSPRPLRNLDIIDALPYNSDARKPASDFHGTVGLAKAPGPLGDGTVYYTLADPADIDLDPADPTNSTGGATRWCTQAELGTTGCPKDLSKVTGFRIKWPGPLAPNETHSYDLLLATKGAVHDDVYTNRIGARADGLALPVQSGDATVRVVDNAPPQPPVPVTIPVPPQDPDDPSQDPEDPPAKPEPPAKPKPPADPPAKPKPPVVPPADPDEPPAPGDPSLADTGADTSTYALGGLAFGLTVAGTALVVRARRRER
ncbi:hypothetical protein [Streptomyces indicus]|uniref:hypothetical protein n=1 Tax=Streptomyces indicus TaxID=417292 RepID=UPI00115F7C36|nr:hypothetical protein [Streptomyces indicus]